MVCCCATRAFVTAHAQHIHAQRKHASTHALKQRKHASNASTQACKHLAVDDKAEPVHDACALFGEVALDEVAKRFSVGGRGAMRHDKGEEEVMGCAHGCGMWMGNGADLVWGGVERSVCGVERSKEIEMISKWTRRCQRGFGFEWIKGWMGHQMDVASRGMVSGKMFAEFGRYRSRACVMDDHAPPCGIPFPAVLRRPSNRSRRR